MELTYLKYNIIKIQFTTKNSSLCIFKVISTISEIDNCINYVPNQITEINKSSFGYAYKTRVFLELYSLYKVGFVPSTYSGDSHVAP